MRAEERRDDNDLSSESRLTNPAVSVSSVLLFLETDDFARTHADLVAAAKRFAISSFFASRGLRMCGATRAANSASALAQTMRMTSMIALSLPVCLTSLPASSVCSMGACLGINQRSDRFEVMLPLDGFGEVALGNRAALVVGGEAGELSACLALGGKPDVQRPRSSLPGRARTSGIAAREVEDACPQR